MPKTSESKSIVSRYEVPIEDSKPLCASVEYLAKPKEISVSIWQEDFFGVREFPITLHRPTLLALQQLVAEILKDHKA